MIIKIKSAVLPGMQGIPELLPLVFALEAYNMWWSFWLPPLKVKCQVLEFKKRIA